VRDGLDRVALLAPRAFGRPTEIFASFAAVWFLRYGRCLGEGGGSVGRKAERDGPILRGRVAARIVDWSFGIRRICSTHYSRCGGQWRAPGPHFCFTQAGFVKVAPHGASVDSGSAQTFWNFVPF